MGHQYQDLVGKSQAKILILCLVNILRTHNAHYYLKNKIIKKLVFTNLKQYHIKVLYMGKRDIY